MKLTNYRTFCFDLDGTVYRGSEPIPETVSFIEKLTGLGHAPYYITNNSSATPSEVKAKLNAFGIKVEENHIMTSAIAAAKYCKLHYGGASVMMIGEKGLKKALTSEGITITKQYPDVVIMGIDRQVSYEKLAEVCLAIRAGAHFIATNSDKAIPTERGLVPGNGSFVKLVEYATGKTPIYVGKPEPEMLKFIQKSGGYEKDKMVMIGDNYDTDILAGIHFGIDTIHLEGGVTSKVELKTKEVQPTIVTRTLLDLLT